jgi:uncharacterized membrane protein YdbT with pleckstrin-like domain
MDLQQGENVIYEGHPSWRSIIHFYILGVVAVLVVAAAAAGLSQLIEDEVKTEWVAIGAIGSLLILLLVGWLKRIATDYTITDRRLIIRRGILSRNVDQTHIDRVQNVSSRQSFLQRLLRVGTVDFDTASNEPENTFAFEGVGDPQGVVRKVDQASQAAGAGGIEDAGQAQQPAPPAPQQPAPEQQAAPEQTPAPPSEPQAPPPPPPPPPQQR